MQVVQRVLQRLAAGLGLVVVRRLEALLLGNLSGVPDPRVNDARWEALLEFCLTLLSLCLRVFV